MPLPFILAGAAVVAAGFGTKKGYDAYQDYDRAESLNNMAKTMYKAAERQLNEQREETQEKLERLGKVKLYLYNEQLPAFLKSANRIKNIDFNKTDFELSTVLKTEELSHLTSEINLISDSLTGGVAALGSGGLAGLATYSGAGWLATASTGTAISSLSGVAATNATLAWFGGGSLATGGLGMAGGTMILGGIVAGPVLAVGGMVMASKAAEAKENAYSNLAQAELAVEQMETAKVKARAIDCTVTEITAVLKVLSQHFMESTATLKEIVSRSTDFRTYSATERNQVGKAFTIAKTIKNILDIQFLDAEGNLTVNGDSKIIVDSKKALDNLS